MSRLLECRLICTRTISPASKLPIPSADEEQLSKSTWFCNVKIPESAESCSKFELNTHRNGFQCFVMSQRAMISNQKTSSGLVTPFDVSSGHKVFFAGCCEQSVKYAVLRRLLTGNACLLSCRVQLFGTLCPMTHIRYKHMKEGMNEGRLWTSSPWLSWSEPRLAAPARQSLDSGTLWRSTRTS